MRVVAGLGLLGALVLRVVLVLRLSSPAAEWTGDARVYLRTAEAMRQFEWLPEAWVWPPGYAFAGLLLSPLGGLGPGLLAASVLGGVLLPALAFWLGHRWRRPVEGTIAAALLAFTPEAVLASTLALSDTLGLALALGSLAVAASPPKRASASAS